jgi:hypothetical protein
MFVPKAQLDAHERIDVEMSIHEDPARQLPGVSVTHMDSDGFDAYCNPKLGLQQGKCETVQANSTPFYTRLVHVKIDVITRNTDRHNC